MSDSNNHKPTIPALPSNFRNADRSRHREEEGPETYADEYVINRSIAPIDSFLVIDIHESTSGEKKEGSDDKENIDEEVNLPAQDFPSTSGFDYPTFYAKSTVARRNSGICETDKTDFFFKQKKHLVDDHGNSIPMESELISQGADSRNVNFMTGYNGPVDGDCERRTQLYVSEADSESKDEINAVVTHEPDSENNPSDLESGAAVPLFAEASAARGSFPMTDLDEILCADATKVVDSADVLVESDGNESVDGNMKRLFMSLFKNRSTLFKNSARSFSLAIAATCVSAVILISVLFYTRGACCCSRNILSKGSVKDGIQSDYDKSIMPKRDEAGLPFSNAVNVCSLLPIIAATTSVTFLASMVCCCVDCSEDHDQVTTTDPDHEDDNSSDSFENSPESVEAMLERHQMLSETLSTTADTLLLADSADTQAGGLDYVNSLRSLSMGYFDRHISKLYRHISAALLARRETYFPHDVSSRKISTARKFRGSLTEHWRRNIIDNMFLKRFSISEVRACLEPMINDSERFEIAKRMVADVYRKHTNGRKEITEYVPSAAQKFNDDSKLPPNRRNRRDQNWTMTGNFDELDKERLKADFTISEMYSEDVSYQSVSEEVMRKNMDDIHILRRFEFLLQCISRKELFDAMDVFYF